MCGTCPGIAELEKGDPEAAIDHVCETTHLRASQVFGRPFIPRWLYWTTDVAEWLTWPLMRWVGQEMLVTVRKVGPSTGVAG